MSGRCQDRHPGILHLTRVLRGVTQDEVGTAAGVDQSVVSRAERGAPISRRARQRIADALQMSIQALFPEAKD